MISPAHRRHEERGAAVVDFVLALVVVVPLVLGIVQVGLVLHVRNTMTAAASEGARYAATADRGPAEGAVRTRELVRNAIAARFASDVEARQVSVAGSSGVRVDVVADVPPLGLWGPALRVEVTGHAVEEQP